MDKPELEPCPFCGEANELYPCFRKLGEDKPYAIDCLGCGIEFEPREGMDVVSAWNTRASRPAPADDVAELGKQIEQLVFNAYIRGVEWGEENPVDFEYRFKAAGDYTDKLAPDLSRLSQQRGAEEWRLVEQLVANEGDAVTILCENPEGTGVDNHAVEICGSLTDWEVKRFHGSTRLVALQAAIRALAPKGSGE